VQLSVVDMARLSDTLGEALFGKLPPSQQMLFRGRPLSLQEASDLYNYADDEFLRAFEELSTEEKVAVRLRYGQCLLKWYKENVRDGS
jgi:hypothetical protein